MLVQQRRVMHKDDACTTRKARETPVARVCEGYGLRRSTAMRRVAQSRLTVPVKRKASRRAFVTTTGDEEAAASGGDGPGKGAAGFGEEMLRALLSGEVAVRIFRAPTDNGCAASASSRKVGSEAVGFVERGESGMRVEVGTAFTLPLLSAAAVFELSRDRVRGTVVGVGGSAAKAAGRGVYSVRRRQPASRLRDKRSSSHAHPPRAT